MPRDHKREMYTQYLRREGRPVIIPAGCSITRVRILYDLCGASFADMAAQTGLVPSTLGTLRSGITSRGKPLTLLYRDSAERVATLRGPGATPGRGQRIDSTATVRRIEALIRAGYPASWVATRIRLSDSNVSRMRIQSRPVHRRTALRVAALYDSYVYRDPREVGLNAYQTGAAFGAARRRNAAPWWCWDEDTIGDPKAIPQWTGHCGTRRGYEIHKRERQFFWTDYNGGSWVIGCKPCRKKNSGRIPSDEQCETDKVLL